MGEIQQIHIGEGERTRKFRIVQQKAKSIEVLGEQVLQIDAEKVPLFVLSGADMATPDHYVALQKSLADMHGDVIFILLPDKQELHSYSFEELVKADCSPEELARFRDQMLESANSLHTPLIPLEDRTKSYVAYYVDFADVYDHPDIRVYAGCDEQAALRTLKEKTPPEWRESMYLETWVNGQVEDDPRKVPWEEVEHLV